MLGGWALWVLIGWFVLWAIGEAILERRRRKQDPYWSVNAPPPKRWSLRWPR